MFVYEHFRWGNYNETPGQAFAQEQARKINEEKKFLPDTKDNSKQESPDAKSESSSSESGSESDSESSSSSESQKSVKEENNEVQPEDKPVSQADSVSNPDQDLEDDANNEIKREKYQGPRERFLKKIGYGGKRVVQETVAHNFKNIIQGKLKILLVSTNKHN